MRRGAAAGAAPGLGCPRCRETLLEGLPAPAARAPARPVPWYSAAMLPFFEIVSTRLLSAADLERGFARAAPGEVIVLEGVCHPGQYPVIRLEAEPVPAVRLSCPVCDKPIIALALAQPPGAAERQEIETICACHGERVVGYLVGGAAVAVLCVPCRAPLGRLPLSRAAAPAAAPPAVRPADILDVFDHMKRRPRP